MCGIVGIWDYKNKISRGTLEKMRNSLSHRGPDDAGIFIDEKNNIGFGHQRLSIIDLSKAGHQPMSNEEGTVWIVHNGEIYNFQELRKTLKNLGYKFKSKSDTEVILHSYQEWGVNCLEKFNGMFAFAIWDKKKEKLFLCRDRVGVKPLYYYFDGNLFIFASEIKAIICHPAVKKEINFDTLSLFLQLGYIPAPHSIFKNIYKLEAGYFSEIDKKQTIKKEKYWDITDFYLEGFEQRNNGKNFNEQEVEKELERILIDSFKLRLVSDVPVGIFLSGGIDSTLVAALLARHTSYPLKSFTIGFEDQEFNEAGYAKEIAKYLGIEHHEMFCTQKDALDIIPKLPEIYDEPFGDSSAIPTYLVSGFARSYLKVSLSADGGDELFAGYSHYSKINNFYQNFKKLPFPLLLPFLFIPSCFIEASSKIFFPNPKDKKEKFQKFKNILKKKDFLNIYKTIISCRTEDEIKKLLKIPCNFPVGHFNQFQRISHLDNISQMQVIDFKNYLSDDILTKVDRATMAVGLESRDPFLDQNIIEYVAKLPLNLKYKNGQRKYILKKILRKYIPEKLTERPKKGFSVPIDFWFKKELRPLLREYLSPQKIEREGIFNKKIVEEELNSYFSGKSVSVNRLWLILMFQLWKEKWL